MTTDSGGPARTAGGRRMPARDRVWLDVDNLRVFGPFHGITADGLRESLVSLHDRQPDVPAVCAVDRGAARWRPLSRPDFAEFSRDLVVDLDDPGRYPGRYSGRLHPGHGDAADAVTRRLVDEPLGDRPLLLAVGGGFVGAKISHAVGDGGVNNRLIPELLRATAQRRPPRPPFPAPTRLPVVRGMLRHFGRHPARLVPALRVSLPPAAPAAPAGGATRAWHPDVRYVSVRSGHALSDIRAWRDRHAPGVSAAAVLFAAARVALADNGLTPGQPGSVILFDARRYLPKGAEVAGNFSWGQYLEATDATDPRAVHARLGGEVASGRPMAMLALRTARQTLWPSHGGAPAPHAVPVDPRPDLTLTHIGRLDMYTDLPWAGPVAERRNISVPSTSGPQAITLSFSELFGALYLNASFHGSTFDPAAVASAVDLICRDPVALVHAAG
ncbi:hypothetical protein ACNTMW_19395 [Planosporangium sp. 12N6]|uniref:hypothetical protein n=1 Tax=Planosporangium spinosum TaxID=3402278 RepID=UPI003CF4A998